MKEDKIEVIKDFVTDEGFRSVIAKMPMGHLCGYVGIPEEHLLYELHYSTHSKYLVPFFNKAKDEKVGNRGILPMFFWDGESVNMELAFNVHGSVTFTSDNLLEEDENDLWWIGFDCAHYGDTPEKCDEGYVESECRNLSRQLDKVEQLWFDMGKAKDEDEAQVKEWLEESVKCIGEERVEELFVSIIDGE